MVVGLVLTRISFANFCFFSGVQAAAEAQRIKLAKEQEQAEYEAELKKKIVMKRVSKQW